jgi:hypothetical protein
MLIPRPGSRGVARHGLLAAGVAGGG